MEIPCEDQFSSYSRSTNGSLRGKALMKYKQKWWDIWRTRMHSFTMYRLCFPPPFSALCNVSHSAKFGEALTKCFGKWTGSRMGWSYHVHLCEHTPWQCPTTALQSFTGRRLRARFVSQKTYCFSFPNSLIFLRHSYLPAKRFIYLRKGCPNVLYLIQYSNLLH